MIPERAGLYEYTCDEAENEWSPIAVYDENGELFMDAEDLLRMKVSEIGDHVTNMRWRRC